jgi:hypothetical protein
VRTLEALGPVNGTTAQLTAFATGLENAYRALQADLFLATGTVCAPDGQSNHHAETDELAVPTTRFSPLDRGTLM